jgi:hypothetical protein
MTDTIERLADKHVNLSKAQIPPSLVDLGVDGMRQVVAAAYLPPREGVLPAHLVVYYRGNGNEPGTGVSPIDRGWAVSIMVQKPDHTTYLAHGDYDLTFERAMALFVQRIETQG